MTQLKNLSSRKPVLFFLCYIMLIEASNDPGLPDGYHQLQTEAAIGSFQRDNALETKGKMGNATINALKKTYTSDD